MSTVTKRPSAVKKWWPVAAVAAAVVVGGWALIAARSGAEVEAVEVQRGPIRQFIDERGITRLPRVHLITMPFPGRLEQIDLVAGDSVSASQVVARIVPADLANEVAEARAAVDRLQASIAENDDTTVERIVQQQAQQFVESMASTLAAATERVRASRERLRYAEANLARVRELHGRGAQTQDDLQRANVAYVDSDVQYRQDELTEKAVASIKAATELLPKLIQEYIGRKVLSRAVLKQQQEEALARLRQAEMRQRRGEMTSPIEGVVLERLESNERFIAAGTVLLRIGDLRQLEVELEVLSQDAVDVTRGNQVEIYGPAVGRPEGRGVPAEVARVHPAGFTKISSLGVEQQRVRVIARFAEDALAELLSKRNLGVDYRVRGRIFTAHKSDALSIPRSALFRAADGSWQAFVVRSRRAALASLKVGLMNDDWVEITEGLSAGNVVILAPETTLSDGHRVQVRLLPGRS